MTDYNDFKNKVVSESFNEKIRVLFSVYEEIYYEKAKKFINDIKHLFDITYNTPVEYTDELLKLFGVKVSDLSFFTDAKKEQIKNNLLANIFKFNKIKLKDIIYTQIMYLYEVTGNVYPQDTYDWEVFFRCNCDVYTDEDVSTDIGLYTDEDLYTDMGYRTPFLEIEFVLDKEYDDGLWYVELDSLIKENLNNIRHILSKLSYTLNCVIECTENATITNDNGVVSISGDMSNIHDARYYKITFDDLSSIVYTIDEYDEDIDYYYIYTENIYNETKNITKIEILDYTQTIVYITANLPTIYLCANSKMLFNFNIRKN
jgi:hypothetical protein